MENDDYLYDDIGSTDSFFVRPVAYVVLPKKVVNQFAPLQLIKAPPIVDPRLQQRQVKQPQPYYFQDSQATPIMSYPLTDDDIDEDKDEDKNEDKDDEKKEETTTALSAQVDKSLLSLDIEDLLKQEGITSINGKKINFGRKTKRPSNARYGAKNSYHKRIDPNTGYAAARDISISQGTNADYSTFKNILLNNKRVRTWMATHNWGIINEIIPQVMGRTKATGPHFHFGPDRWAKRIWSYWLSNPKTYVTTYIS